MPAVMSRVLQCQQVCPCPTACLPPLRWGTDYIIKMNLGGGRFVGQIGNGQEDHSFWRRPDEITQPFPVYVLTPGAPGRLMSSAGPLDR